jgi:hypothetical protein
MKPSRILKIGLALSAALLMFLLSWRVVTVFHQNAVLAGRTGDRVWAHIHRFGLTVARVKGLPDAGAWEWWSAPAQTAGFGMPWIFQGSRFSSHDYLPGFSTGSGPATMTGGSTPGVVIQASVMTVAWIWIVLLPLLLTLGLLSKFIWQRHISARRLRMGLCVHCGYDLRGTPGRCPECGAAKDKITAASILPAPRLA